MQREDIWKSKDGMDQAKWCIPRLREHTLAKEMGKFQRPRLKLHAVWVNYSKTIRKGCMYQDIHMLNPLKSGSYK